jgi:hypothetical protein
MSKKSSYSSLKSRSPTSIDIVIENLSIKKKENYLPIIWYLYLLGFLSFLRVSLLTLGLGIWYEISQLSIPHSYLLAIVYNNYLPSWRSEVHKVKLSLRSCMMRVESL